MREMLLRVLRQSTANTVTAAAWRQYRLDASIHGHGATVAVSGSADVASVSPAESISQVKNEQLERLANLLNAYRRYGYLAADLDPLELTEPREVPELEPSRYGIDEAALAGALRDNAEATGADFLAHLHRQYCGPLAAEFMHITNMEERSWFADAFERCLAEPPTDEERIEALKVMLEAKAWEEFLAKKFPTLKRYSSEGAESTLALHQYLLESCADYGVREFVFDGAHRGRLALQTSLFQFPPAQIFRKIRGKSEFPDDVQGSGDVLTHQPSHFDYRYRALHRTGLPPVHVTTLPNPSHLEASLAVALGRCRARAQTLRVGDYAPPSAGAAVPRVGDAILCVHHHGDGAFVGQGVVWESVQLSAVPHFRVGGSIHVIVNNQVAFTAEAPISRTSAHCSDIAKALDAPAIHVNAERIDEVLLAGRLALAYRQRYRKEVFINLLCYRRHGHNELDEPALTQPVMYRTIDVLRSEQGDVVSRLVDRLADSGVWTADASRAHFNAHLSRLAEDLAAVDAGKVAARCDHLAGQWTGLVQAPAAVERWDSGLPTNLLRYIGLKSVETPEGFAVHPHLQRTHVEARRRRLADRRSTIDWSTAEALAFGSLLLQGFDVRISGQDIGRATFSHRHAMLVDQETDAVHIPLNHLRDRQEGSDNQCDHQKAFIEIANSPLSEAAVVGFEYGFAMESPRRLVLWEAQFGDFYNGAQVQIDTLLATGESKWLRQNGLVLTLPHGFDGAGPDHSSAHLERFLQLTDSAETAVDGENVNIHVVQPTTSAQYFHLLRRQMLTPYRKPLILIGPKVLLRHSAAAVPLDAFGPGTYFHPVLDNTTGTDRKPADVQKVIFTSGKHAITVERALAERSAAAAAAVVRLERLCPFPADELAQTLKRYDNAKEFIWSQEEPRNAGAWTFVEPRFRNLLGVNLRYAGRPALAWMATAGGVRHAAEARQLIDETLG